MGKITDWIDFSDLYVEETKQRESIDPKRLCNYGVKCLDDALHLIGKNELVVIGADTGTGKSELALHIAQHNAMQGKKVGVYYLEGGAFEAMQRVKWKYMSKMYYQEHGASALPISYKKWINNSEHSPLLTEIEGRTFHTLSQKLKNNLYFFPSKEDFTIEKFTMSLLGFLEWVESTLYLDLIVIDHLK